MKLRTAAVALASALLHLCTLPALAEQNPLQASENSSAFTAAHATQKFDWDNIAKFEVNPAFRTLASNSYGTSCAAISNPYPYQWCVDATTRQVYLNTQPAGGGAFAWRSAFSLNADGTLNQASIADGSISGRMLAPGAVTANIGFVPVQSVAGRGGNVSLSAGDISGLAPSATTDTTNASNITSGTINRPLRDFISVKDHGATGDGTTDDTASIVATISAVPANGTAYLPCGSYKLSGSGAEAFLITKAINVLGAGKCVSFVGSLGASTDLFHVRPGTGAVLRGLRFSGFSIGLSAGAHQFHFDSNASNTSEMAEVEVDHISSTTVSGHFAYIDNPISNTNGGTFNANIHDNVVSAPSTKSGVELLNAGDTIRVRDNILTGAGYAVHGSQIAGAGQLIVEGNNITANGGVVILGGTKPIIRHNEIELISPATATNGFMVGLTGVDGGTISDNQIQSLSGSSLGENIFIGTGSTNVVVEANRLFTSATSVAGINFATGVTGMAVGCGNSFFGFAPAANVYGDLSGVTQCPAVSSSTVPVTLAAQAPPILRSQFVGGSTTSESAMEFFDAGQINAVTGSVITKLAADNYKRAKVAHYRAITGGASAGDMYAGNWLCNSELGHNGNCIAGELDLNDANTSQNSAVSFADLQAGLNVRSGLYISGSTVNPVSGSILINMAANGFKAQRAIGVFNGTIAGDVYDDNVDAPSGNVIRSTGNKAGGIELSGLTIASGVAMDLKQGHAIRWINGGGTQTSAVSTDGSNVLQLGTGAAGVNLASPLSSVKMSVVTVASLPTCNSGTKGTMQAVSDAAASPAYNATVAGGGSVSIPVYCNGTNWTNH